MADNTKTEKEKSDGGVSPFAEFMKKDGFIKLTVAAGIVGIVLIFISSSVNLGGNNNASEVSEQPLQLESDISVSRYKEELCEELGNMLASIEGVGRTKIMLTLDSTVRNIYATDNDYQDGSEKALTVGQTMPSVKGVLVVCDGGDDKDVCGRVISAVSAALNISDSHICVTKMNS